MGTSEKMDNRQTKCLPGRELHALIDRLFPQLRAQNQVTIATAAEQ